MCQQSIGSLLSGDAQQNPAPFLIINETEFYSNIVEKHLPYKHVSLIHDFRMTVSKFFLKKLLLKVVEKTEYQY